MLKLLVKIYKRIEKRILKILTKRYIDSIDMSAFCKCDEPTWFKFVNFNDEGNYVDYICLKCYKNKDE